MHNKLLLIIFFSILSLNLNAKYIKIDNLFLNTDFIVKLEQGDDYCLITLASSGLAGATSRGNPEYKRYNFIELKDIICIDFLTENKLK